MLVTRTVPDVAELVALGREQGLDAVGVASAEPFEGTRRELERRKAAGLHGRMAFTYRSPERSTTPDGTVPGARALVVGARSYWRAQPPSPIDDGAPLAAVARYAWSDHYAPLREALGAVAQRLVGHGWRARVLADDNALVDRAAAHRAGLGWYGKNANLLLPGCGSWFVLGSVVTDAPLADGAAPEAVPDGCGTCTRCIEACPTGAIVAPGVVDARRCLAWLVQADGAFPQQHRVALGDRIYGCDDCQEVCPPNRRVARTANPPAVPGGSEAQVDVVDLLASSDDELLARHGRWYIPKRDPRYVRRNALVVLGNVGDPRDARVVDAVRAALTSTDPMLRAHAVWAARRMGLAALLTLVEGDPAAVVQDELAAPVEVRD
ncbi:MAG: tRNA epoxyqueuosine(34) reductase QueG [Acidimicrobiales bacterium]